MNLSECRFYILERKGILWYLFVGGSKSFGFSVKVLQEYILLECSNKLAAPSFWCGIGLSISSSAGWASEAITLYCCSSSRAETYTSAVSSRVAVLYLANSYFTSSRFFMYLGRFFCF